MYTGPKIKHRSKEARLAFQVVEKWTSLAGIGMGYVRSEPQIQLERLIEKALKTRKV